MLPLDSPVAGLSVAAMIHPLVLSSGVATLRRSSCRIEIWGAASSRGAEILHSRIVRLGRPQGRHSRTPYRGCLHSFVLHLVSQSRSATAMKAVLLSPSPQMV